MAQIDPILKLAQETIERNKQAIVFCPSRASAEKTAEEVSKRTTLSLPVFEKSVLKASSTPTKQCRRLSHIIRKGVAFHHAGLLQKQKDLIEEGFKGGDVKVICATPTLAAGLSLPVFRVIIKSLKRYSGRWGMDWIPVLEYLQMAGRAGRPEYETFGEAICIAKSDTEKDEIHQRYVLGEPEEIYSKLAVEPVLRTYMLSLIASGIIRDERAMKEFFAKTFWAHQFDDMAKLESIMTKMLDLLEEWEFVLVLRDKVKSSSKRASNDFVVASSLREPSTKDDGDVQLRATALGRRVSELYLDPLTARHILDCLMNYSSEKSVFSLIQMISHTLEMRPLLRIKKSEEDSIQEELVERYNLLLQDEPSAYDVEYGEFMNSIKTSLFFESWIDELGEDVLLEKFGIRPGEIRVKLEIADWLLYASSELGKIVECKQAVRELRRLRVRVKNGVREELLALLKLKGIGRKRARKLFAAGIKDLGDVKKVDITTLAQLLGKVVAENVKQQVGEKVVSQVSAGKRKGQMSLGKY